MNNGYVVVAGRLLDIDTQAYSIGTQLYLSSTTAGAYTSTKQYAPNHLVYVGIIVRSHPTQGVIEVKIQNGYELDELHNVSAQTPTNNDGLFWEASTSLWKNKSLATIIGGTPAYGSGTQNRITKFTANAGELIDSNIHDTGSVIYNNNPTNGQFAWQFNGSQTTGLSYGALIVAGTNASDIALRIQNASSTSEYFFVWGDGRVQINNIPNATTDTDRFLVSDSGVIKYRTGTQLLSDIGGQPAGTYVTSVGLSAPTGFAVSGSPVTSTGTLALSFATGYSLPTNASQTNWDTAYTNRITSATSPLSITSNVISIAQASGSTSGYLSSTDWTMFNNKQSALTNPVTGTGTTNYLPKFTGTSTIGNSIVSESGSVITVAGTIVASNRITINGNNDLVFYGASSSTGYMHLQLANTGNTTRLAQEGSTGGNMAVGSSAYATILNSTGAYSLQLATNNNVRATIDSSGNLGLGVTPSAGLATANYRLFEIGLDGGGSLYSGSNQTLYGTNISWVGGTPNYVRTGSAPTLYNQSNGAHSWSTAPTGTAGNAISFTQAMTLDASGRLGVGTTSLNNLITFNQTIGGSPANLSELEPYATVKIKGRPDRNNIVYVGAIDALTGMLIQSGTTSTAANLAINPFGGSVGIGTTSPSYNLDVSSNVNSENTIRSINLNSGAAATARIYVENNIGSFGQFTTYSSGFGFTVFGLFAGNYTSLLSSGASSAGLLIGSLTADPVIFGTDNIERMRISSGGKVCINTTTVNNGAFLNIGSSGSSRGDDLMTIFNPAVYGIRFLSATGGGSPNTSIAHMLLGNDGTTGRSINASGTINASGADYAEYMTKAVSENIAKGDIIGVDANGLLTNIYADAISFVVKSTDPSYVGGDKWGANLKGAELETARQKVDRVAFSGQVPCNVLNAQVGDYIIPINVNGKIKGEAVTNPTFEQYQISVGKVWKIMEDGRAWIAIKIG